MSMRQPNQNVVVLICSRGGTEDEREASGKGLSDCERRREVLQNSGDPLEIDGETVVPDRDSDPALESNY